MDNSNNPDSQINSQNYLTSDWLKSLCSPSWISDPVQSVLNIYRMLEVGVPVTIENCLSGKHFAYKESKRSRCAVCSKQISPTTGRRMSKHTIIALSVMCFFALVPALSYTTHVPLYSDCIDVFTVLHVCLFQSNCVENISTVCFLALVPASSYTTHVPLYSDCIDVFTVLHVCLFQSNISTATRGCAELGIGHFDLGVW